MQTLPLFYYPSTLVWVDDDKLFLETMSYAFSQHYRVKSFRSSPECLDFLMTYRSPLAPYHFLTSNKADENYGLLQRTPIDFDVTKIAAIADDPNRFDEISVLVIDNHMPEMNGLTLAKRIPHLNMQKILLTGNTPEDQAVESFNDNLIQRFVRKADDGMYNKLTQHIRNLSIHSFQQLTAPLLAYLETEAKMPQSDLFFIDFFKHFCSDNNVKEYYLIDKQGSYLCIDNNNQRFCFAVHSDESLANWLALYGDNSHLTDDDLSLIKTHKKMPFFGVGKEAWQVEPELWSQHLYKTNLLDANKNYYWAKVDLK